MKNEEEGETDDDLVTNLVDIISYVAKILKNDFFLLFENILQKFAEQISCHDSHPQVSIKLKRSYASFFFLLYFFVCFTL